MLPLGSVLSIDEPISDLIESPELHTWWAALLLVSSNLFYLPATVYAYQIYCGYVGAYIGGEIVISAIYHLCQTVKFCFGGNIAGWTLLDHLFALTMVAVLFLFTINTLSETISRKENVIYDRWTSSISVVYLIVVVLAVMAHPYSMQSYLIGIGFGLSLVFMKLLVIDGGEIGKVYDKISPLDLAMAIIFVFIGLVFFMIDGYINYIASHFFWHVFGGLGYYFYLASITKNLSGHYSPVSKILSIFSLCQTEQEEGE